MSLRSLMARVGAASGLLMASWAAQAQSVTNPIPLPEPEMWALLGVAAVVGAVVSRKRK